MSKTTRAALHPDAVAQPVTIEYSGGVVTVPAYIVPGDTWNGWEQPWLPLSSIYTLMNRFDPAKGDAKIERSGRYGRTLTVTEESYPDEPYTLIPDTVTPGGELLWSWDTSWCWYILDAVAESVL